MKTRIGLATGVAGLLAATASGAATLGVNATAYSLGNGGSTLVTVATPTGAGSGGAVELTDEAGASVSLDGIDFRPSTRVLFGYSDANDTVYTVDVSTGIATAVGSSAGFTNDPVLDIDFNPQVDAFRVVNSANENVVFNPNTGGFVTATTTPASTPLFYADGGDPEVAFNAYTNSVFGSIAASTQQFTIDFERDILTALNNNMGMLTPQGGLTLAGVPFDATEEGGFDILSFFAGDNTAFALLTEALTGQQAIYEVSLFGDAAGSLSFVADVTSEFADFGTLDGLAVAPIPLPAAGLLLVGGLGSLALIRRRRRAA